MPVNPAIHEVEAGGSQILSNKGNETLSQKQTENRRAVHSLSGIALN
jgi:hypothetical protein